MNIYNIVTNLLLKLMAINFNLRPSINKYARSGDDWINFIVGIRTETNMVKQSIQFKHGKATVYNDIPDNCDVILHFVKDEILKEMLFITPNELLNYILKNKLIIYGNYTYLQLFNFYVSLLMGSIHQQMLKISALKDSLARKKLYSLKANEKNESQEKKEITRLKGIKEDKGVLYLDDPYLSHLTLKDFPRVKEFLDIHFNTIPEICPERPKLLTDWYKLNGFEKDKNGNEFDPMLRQAMAFDYFMENRIPIIRNNDLIGGTTTSKDVGVIVYPDAHGTMIWGELKTVNKRVLNPYKVSDQTIDILHKDVFPFWVKRNFGQWVREKYDSPKSMLIGERFVAYFVWKTVGISHTIPDFHSILQKGTLGIINEINEKINNNTHNQKQTNTLKAMIIVLEAINKYALSLSKKALSLSKNQACTKRKKELQNINKIFQNIPKNPPATLEEAINAIWIIWIGLHMENTNTGLSLGRLDQLLQPFYINDMKKLKTPRQREDYIKFTIEIIACFFMRCNDHVPLIPDIGNHLFSGSSSDQAITLGGVTQSGEDAVCDMTYIFLKVTELLSVKDPNINARYHCQKNSDTYLKRLCEVNLITKATPSMHNDQAVFKSLEQHSYPIEHIRDWSATGCVEPTLSGRHMGHTGSILLNLVAAFEMALHNGVHPLMNKDFGPKTGSIEKNDFKNFNDFLNAFSKQLKFLIDNAVELNNMLAEAHAQIRPTPFLSSLIDGCINKAMDVTEGGALYNSSGSANIGLADVIDSMLVIKKIVFDEKIVSFTDLKKDLCSNFKDNPKLHSLVQKKVDFFGSGNKNSLEMAKKITSLVHDMYKSHKNFRGGPYTSGFWSMSQHSAYGSLSGALPSGRLAWKAFTPGLTPHSTASKNFLDNLRDVAQLDPSTMDNNIAFNVKLNPAIHDNHGDIVNIMHSYVKTYFKLGGMQLQFNIMSTQTLKDAMVNPEKYKDLMVRISGYNAYFVTLNKEMQIELIERSEFKI